MAFLCERFGWSLEYVGGLDVVQVDELLQSLYAIDKSRGQVE